MKDCIDLEKSSVAEGVTPALPTNTNMPRTPFDKAAERNLLWKLDFTVLPLLWLLYLVCFVDRSNIGNAKIQGMEKELNLKGQKYNVAVFIFNIGYVIARVPLAITFKKVGPRFLPMMMFSWIQYFPTSSNKLKN
ncbi:hypothetical protein E8E13_007594 [Curvularia kusanoi]|uniref:Uncharacterized protein n=1 Tax=Curvularia kusanoi TaxID=90978 RepID=A0A9P4TGE4_CURKU|nr:hypothetical protein E8E13_007594 [Curvularia kusanoi]